MAHDQLLKVNAKLSVLKQYSENISHGSMGLQLARQAVPPMHRLSHGYFYINLPPIFMCLLSVVLMYMSKKDLLFYFSCRCSL